MTCLKCECVSLLQQKKGQFFPLIRAQIPQKIPDKESFQQEKNHAVAVKHGAVGGNPFAPAKRCGLSPQALGGMTEGEGMWEPCAGSAGSAKLPLPALQD